MSDEKAKPEEIGVKELAKRRGISVPTASNFLKGLEKKYGTLVVYRRKSRMYTTEEALAPFVVLEPSAKTANALNRHTKQLVEHDRDIGVLLEFRDNVMMWLKRIDTRLDLIASKLGSGR